MLLAEILEKHSRHFAPVVKFAPGTDKVVGINLTSGNSELSDDIISDIHLFEEFINRHLQVNDATFAIGGYLENRDLYRRSEVFDGIGMQEPRRIHVGMDIWGKAGTAIYAPLTGVVHSTAYNDVKGDYGATIILKHVLDGCVFHTLYGHLMKSDLVLKEGDTIQAGDILAHFGNHHENGFWPPHLHFQVIEDMEGKKGDYPGVCSKSTKPHYERNCLNPDLILRLNQFI